jgi:gentisate 1,2-dioxygenase
MTPLWEVLGALVPPSPRTPVAAALWRYGDVRDEVARRPRHSARALLRRRFRGEGVLMFSYSDRPAQQALGLWREQRL